jgi:hypothetical protein
VTLEERIRALAVKWDAAANGNKADVVEKALAIQSREHSYELIALIGRKPDDS